jgi:hypothetical protein
MLASLKKYLQCRYANYWDVAVTYFLPCIAASYKENPSRLHLSLFHRSVSPPPASLAGVGRSGEPVLYVEFLIELVFSID